MSNSANSQGHTLTAFVRQTQHAFKRLLSWNTVDNTGHEYSPCQKAVF